MSGRLLLAGMTIILCGAAPTPHKTKMQICAEAADTLYKKEIMQQLATCQDTALDILCAKSDKACVEEIKTFCKVGAKLKLMQFLDVCFDDADQVI